MAIIGIGKRSTMSLLDLQREYEAAECCATPDDGAVIVGDGTAHAPACDRVRALPEYGAPTHEHLCTVGEAITDALTTVASDEAAMWADVDWALAALKDING